MLAYVDIQAVLLDYLLDVEGVKATSTKTPNPFTAANSPFVRVTRLGGPDDMITDFATVDVHVFATSEAVAQTVAEAVRQAMRALPFTALDGVAVDRTRTLVGPYWADYGDENIQRYIATYQVESRITAS